MRSCLSLSVAETEFCKTILWFVLIPRPNLTGVSGENGDAPAEERRAGAQGTATKRVSSQI